ncbi:response regulator transcription factor [Bilifractor sp. LCP19S3_H10]|uniref:response regulator transcription factor n=1 Tax=unclassified Bilifractor TaxID=2815795 RepID=UPI003F93F56C
MLKVFLVEDEYIIREAIRKTINWEQEGFELTGEAGDGEKAYPMIMQSRPDILITDIRMPFMDGLELSRLVCSSLPHTRIIILSGYDDFSYAREAISIGVTEYLLKPVTGAKLLETMKKIGTDIAAERERENYRAIYEKEHEERIRLERSAFLKNVISGRYSMTRLMEMSHELGIRLSAAFYQIILFQCLVSQDRRAGRRNNPGDGVMDMLDALRDVFCCEQVGGSVCILVTGSDADSMEQNRASVMEAIRRGMADADGYIYFTSTGPAVEHISEIADSYHLAGRMFAQRFLYDEGREFVYDRDASSRRPGSESRDSGRGSLSDRDAVEFWQMDRTYIHNFLASGDVDDIDVFCDTIVKNIGIRNLSSLLFRQYIMMDVYLICAGFLGNCGCTKDEIEEACGAFYSQGFSASMEEAERQLKQCFSATLALRDKYSETQSLSLTQEAQKYIKKHFCENDLSLGKVAGAIGVSSNYLSHMFSQKTGHTFIEYLTGLRMDQAKKLMKTTDLTSAEIGMKVGYSDAHYFYYIFKKTLDMTPKEYRNRVTEAEEP